jgi:hypothetical protein
MNRRRFVKQSAVTSVIGAGCIDTATASVSINSSTRIRIARPTDQLASVVAFYRDALGLRVIGHFESRSRNALPCSRVSKRRKTFGRARFCLAGHCD